MHPAQSVIVFTTASGAGYGLIVVAFVCDLLGCLPHGRATTLVVFGLAVLLVAAGLLASTFHLGHPERAWRAVSQWRTSWLSREGVAALWTFLPVGAWALVRLLSPDGPHVLELLLGAVAAASALVTLYCTAMIYASLRPVPAWSNRWTPAGYLILGPMCGAVLMASISHALGFASVVVNAVALVLVVAGFVIKTAYWRHLDLEKARSTAATAIGLGPRVDLLQAPHTGSNYLMREMGFRIARKHSKRLRSLTRYVGFGIPMVALLVSLWTAPSAVPGMVALIATAIGVVAERYLFFAEAKHAQSLYYGERAV